MAIDYCSLLENNYGLRIKRLAATSGGQLAECDDGRIYVFKQSRSSPEKIICTQVALKHLMENGFAEGQPYVEALSGLQLLHAVAGTGRAGVRAGGCRRPGGGIGPAGAAARSR